jgi:dihydroneopterin aldolase
MHELENIGQANWGHNSYFEIERNNQKRVLMDTSMLLVDTDDTQACCHYNEIARTFQEVTRS